MKKTINYFDGLEDKPSPVLQEIAVIPGIGKTIGVRAAKAHLSALLDLAEQGQNITITSGGKPKAVIASPTKLHPRKRFSGAAAHLAKMPPWRGGPTADEIIREDRDSRGW
jgi:prevent-host-death family protein